MSERTRIDSVPPGQYVPTADQRVVMNGLSWEAFESFLTLRGDAGPRVTYLEGTLELMSPSKNHEIIKTRFAAILEEYLSHAGITFEGVGSWLVKHAPKEVGLEPDECYILHDLAKDRPDLAIEIVWTSGGIDRLELYRRLGVPEVWFWIDDRIEIYYGLRGGAYKKRGTSRLLPEFPFAMLLELLDLPSLSEVRKQARTRFESL